MINIESRLRALEDSTPQTYEGYDAQDNVTISSNLSTIEWYLDSLVLLQSKGRVSEKAALRAQLVRTARDNGGSRLFEVLSVWVDGPIKV